MEDCPALSQQAVTDYVYSICNGATFTSNSSFARNLNTMNTSKTLYWNVTVTSASSNASDYVCGMHQCRGDVSLSDCSSCVSTILSSGNDSCGHPAMGMRVQLKGCYIRYENYNYFGAAEEGTVENISCSTTQNTNIVFQTNLATVLNDTLLLHTLALATMRPASAMAGAQPMNFSSSQCAACLSQVISSYSTLCGNSVSGELYYVTCSCLFDHSSFLSFT